MASINSASARGVTISRIHQDTTSIPVNAAINNVNIGENLSGGPLDSLVLRVTTVTAANNLCASDFSSLINSVAVNFNGERVHQFNAANNNITALNQPGQYGYFLNSLGGRFSEIAASATNREAYFRIPIGQVLPSGVARLEMTLTYAAAAAVGAITGTFEIFAVYNTNMQTSTFIPTSTSSTAMPAGQQQVVVRIPQKTGFVVSGILILNDTEAGGVPIDNLAANGIVNTSQGPYGLDADFLRLMNGDLSGSVRVPTTVSTSGFDGGAAGTETAGILDRVQSPGAIFLPTFGLAANSDVILLVDSTAAGSNRIFIPVLTAQVGANMPTQPVQTAAAKTYTQKAILDRVDV